MLPFAAYAALSLLILRFADPAQPLLRRAGYASRSVIGFFDTIGERANTVWLTLLDHNRWEQRYGELEREINSLRFELLDYDEIFRENIGLRRQLRLGSRLEHEHKLASIVARDPVSGFSEAFIVNIGENRGIVPDSPVVAFNEAGEMGLVGRITDVGIAYSRVLPLNSDQSHVAVKLAHINRHGLAAGNGSEQLALSYIGKSAADFLSVKDLVVSSGDEKSLFPSGIPVGRIIRIENNSSDTSLRIRLQPVVSIAELDYVYVLERRSEYVEFYGEAE